MNGFVFYGNCTDFEEIRKFEQKLSNGGSPKKKKNSTRNYFVLVKGLFIFNESVPPKARPQQTELYTYQKNRKDP